MCPAVDPLNSAQAHSILSRQEEQKCRNTVQLGPRQVESHRVAAANILLLMHLIP